MSTPDLSARDLIKRRIAEQGPITVAGFMRLALSEPGIGYYTTRDPLGAAGDFVTAPEISQMFGEMIGLWCVDLWEKFGRPDPFLLVELGPGRGTLMADALRAARVRPEFLQGMRLHLVEISPPLRAQQSQRLSAFAPIWHEDIAALPAGPMILIANEFLDALPIHQFQMTAEGWRERAVDAAGGELAWTHLAPGPELSLLRPEHGRAKPDDIAEICPAARTVAETLAKRFARDVGAALFLDYGPARSGLGDSLQALRGHRPADPLRDAGQVDLTAHVDFAALADAARKAGANAFGPIGQGPFLQVLGIEQRAAMLAAKANAEDRAAIAATLHRLIAPAQMGSLFKALAIAAPQLTELAGFSLISLGTLGELDGIRHGFMTRHGGVSDGLYASLNCGIGSNDQPDKVRENRARALKLAELPEDSLFTAYQIHSADVLVVDGKWSGNDRPRVDAMVTKTKGITLGVLSADCVPVLFADPEVGIVGAAHAGWRGAVTGVLQATVKAMVDLGAKAERVRAAIGPCIGGASYEVGAEFPAPFLAQDPAHAKFFRPGLRDGHRMFDIEGYVTACLKQLKLAEVEAAHRDTCGEREMFFSYRRSVLRNEPDYGRHVSVIGLV